MPRCRVEFHRNSTGPAIRASASPRYVTRRHPAQAQIWKDAPWVFLVSPDTICAKSKKLSGVYIMPGSQMLTEDAALN
jgi:hypothetical protein